MVHQIRGIKKPQYLHVNIVECTYVHRNKSLHGIAWHCMALHGIAWYCMALHGIAWHLHGIAPHCMALHGIARHCMAYTGISLTTITHDGLTD